MFDSDATEYYQQKQKDHLKRALTLVDVQLSRRIPLGYYWFASLEHRFWGKSSDTPKNVQNYLIKIDGEFMKTRRLLVNAYANLGKYIAVNPEAYVENYEVVDTIQQKLAKLLNTESLVEKAVVLIDSSPTGYRQFSQSIREISKKGLHFTNWFSGTKKRKNHKSRAY